MNGPDGFNPRGGDNDESERMEAAGVVDAQSGAHNSLENAETAFPTAPTRLNVSMFEVKNSVTYVPGQICYLGRRPLNPSS
jgi:hypothetical protein